MSVRGMASRLNRAFPPTVGPDDCPRRNVIGVEAVEAGDVPDRDPDVEPCPRCGGRHAVFVEVAEEVVEAPADEPVTAGG